MKCLGIQKLEEIAPNVHACKVMFDDIDYPDAMFIYNYAEALQFVEQDVDVTFRQDLYRGNLLTFVNTISLKIVVHTLENTKDIKLYTDFVDNHSNIAFSDIGNGEKVNDAIMYCLSCEVKNNEQREWIAFKVRDKRLKVMTLRLFSPEQAPEGFVGKYIECDVKRNKYGLSTTFLTINSDLPVTSPEVILAKNSIMEELTNNNDTELIRFLEETKLLNLLEEYVSVDKGYELVKLAYQLRLCNCYSNLLSNVNIDLLRHALVMSYTYLMNQKSKLSPKFLSVNATLRCNLSDKTDIAVLLDGETETNETLIYNNIKESSELLIFRQKSADICS